MEITVTRKQGVCFVAETRGHRLVGDQPRGNGGEDEGMTPPEWLLSALASCVGYYVVKYCEARDLDCRDLRVVAGATKSNDYPLRMDGFTVDIYLPDHLDERDRKGLLHAAERCLIHQTLARPNQVHTQLHEN